MSLKKMERYLRVNLLGPGPRLLKKRIYRAVVSQWLSNTGILHKGFTNFPRPETTSNLQAPECDRKNVPY